MLLRKITQENLTRETSKKATAPTYAYSNENLKQEEKEDEIK